MLAFDTAEDVGRRAFLWVAEWVAFRRCYLAVEVQVDARVEWAGGTQLVEERAFQGNAVRDLHDALGGDVVHRAEGLLDPGVHRLRRDEAARRRGDVEDAVCEDAILGRAVGDQGPKVGYLTFGRHRLHGLLSGGLQACVEVLAVGHTLHVTLDTKFQARYLVGQADRASDVRDLYLRHWPDALHVTVVRDGDDDARTGEDDDLRTEVVELA